MDEQAIRMWAYGQASEYKCAHESITSHKDRLIWAEEIAFWVMWGELPEEAENV